MGFVDLHCHYVPGIDDGVKTLDEGVELCTRLHQLGFERVVATPHIRTAMFENRRHNLLPTFNAFTEHAAVHDNMPNLGLGAEHFLDDIFWELVRRDEHVPYPGGMAILVEFSPRQLPMGLEQQLFELQVAGLTPVIAHPERYGPVQQEPDRVRKWRDRDCIPMLDLMSLVGHYGSAPKRTAEALLDIGAYGAACSDCHRPGDVDKVAAALEILEQAVGHRGVTQLLERMPRELISGDMAVAPLV